MNWFLNLRISRRIALCFGASLIVALCASLIAMQRMLDMSAGSRSLQSTASASLAMGRLLSDEQQYRYQLLKLVAASDSQDVDRTQAQADALRADAANDLAAYERRITDSQDRENFGQLSNDWNEAQALQPRILQDIRSGNLNAARRLLLYDGDPVFGASQQQAQTIVDWNSQAASTRLKEISQERDAGIMIVAFLMVVAVIVSIAAGSVATRSITGGISDLSRELENLDRGFEGVAQNTDAMAAGDFVFREIHRCNKLAWARQDELGDLARAIDEMMSKAKRVTDGIIGAQKSLTQLVGSVRNSADEIAASSSQIASGNEDLASRTSEEAASLEETAASMEEMTSLVKQSAENAQKADEMAAHAKEVAQNGGEVVARAVCSMNEINASSKRISDIIAVIDEIAFQTNLLALNAAVEAARVGEQGRGFAVVASEVRNLAGRSSTAAKEIKTLVQDSVRKVEGGSELVNKSGEQLKEIVDAVDKVADIVDQISSAAQEQSAGIEQVNKAVVQLDQITQQNAALVEEASAASQTMAHHAGQLDEQVRKFHFDESLLVGGAAPSAPAAKRPSPQTPAQTLKAETPRLKVVGGIAARDDF